MARYIQIGTTALRDPVTMEMLQAVPMYIRAEDAGREAAPDYIMNNFAERMAAKWGEYVEASRTEKKTR